MKKISINEIYNKTNDFIEHNTSIYFILLGIGLLNYTIALPIVWLPYVVKIVFRLLLPTFLMITSYMLIHNTYYALNMTLQQILRYVCTRYLTFFITDLIFKIIIGIGAIFFIIPGILFMIKYSQARFIVLFEPQNTTQSFLLSSQRVKGNRIVILLLTLIEALLTIYLPLMISYTNKDLSSSLVLTIITLCIWIYFLIMQYFVYDYLRE